MTIEALDELRGKLRRAEDWLAEARRNHDALATQAWKVKIEELRAELKKEQGR